MSLDFRLEIAVDTGGEEPYVVTLLDVNATHNLMPMWDKAGVYEALYNCQGKTASQIVDVLEKGLADMQANPHEYIPLEPANGWGNYQGAVKFLQKIVIACHEHPKSIISIWA